MRSRTTIFRRAAITMMLAGLWLAACQEGQPAVETAAPPEPSATTEAMGMPNPASVYCEEQGYRLELRTAVDGSQQGFCLFPDGSECEEWAFFRNECAPAASAEATPTSTAAPGPVQPDEAATAGWMEYVEANYGFRFRYPPDWTAELDLRADSTTYQHLLWLRAPSKPRPDVVLSIAFEREGEGYGLQRTGIGSGELVERGSLIFLGEETPRIALVMEGIDMEVMYGGMGAFSRGDLRFAISLRYEGVERLGLTPELEDIADLIVASFELSE